MQCKICGSKEIRIVYNGKIRNGGVGKYTENNIPIYQCENCRVLWHETVVMDMKEYYESTEYRNLLEGGSEEADFYRLHDKENMNKFQYTGTTIFRNKIVADVGCGCGAFLDFLSGAVNKVIAIEPSEKYREVMERKGFLTFPYTEDAVAVWKENVDVVTSFDVIEHVQNPEEFLKGIFDLLKTDGQAIIGTPTDAPMMRMLLGEAYERKLLFSVQHLWIFSEQCLKMLAEKIGFSKVSVKYYQRYGIDNMIGWVKHQKPNSEINLGIINETISSVWKSQLSEAGLADYLVLYLQK